MNASVCFTVMFSLLNRTVRISFPLEVSKLVRTTQAMLALGLGGLVFIKSGRGDSEGKLNDFGAAKKQ